MQVMVQVVQVMEAEMVIEMVVEMVQVMEMEMECAPQVLVVLVLVVLEVVEHQNHHNQCLFPPVLPHLAHLPQSDQWALCWYQGRSAHGTQQSWSSIPS